MSKILNVLCMWDQVAALQQRLNLNVSPSLSQDAFSKGQDIKIQAPGSTLSDCVLITRIYFSSRVPIGFHSAHAR